MTTLYEWTRYDAEHPVAKTYAADPATGGPASGTPGAQPLTFARVRKRVGTDSDFRAEFMAMTPNSALSFGLHDFGDDFTLTTKAEDPDRARTNKNMRWPKGPGIMMFDYDPPAGEGAVDPRELVGALCATLPGADAAPMMLSCSSGSFIRYPDGTDTGLRGQRIYLFVSDASLIPRTGRILTDRLWLAGAGRAESSAAGTVLYRSLFDAAVWQPSRVDYAGLSHCVPPVAKSDRPAYLDNARAAPYDLSGVRDLTEREKDEVTNLKQAAGNALKESPEFQAIREGWIEKRLEGVPDLDRDARRQQLVSTLERGVLNPDDVVHVADERGGTFPATVRELLTDPARFHRRGCLDPLEPDYSSNPTIGRINLDGTANIHSMAHGGKVYYLSSGLAEGEAAATPETGKTRVRVSEDHGAVAGSVVAVLSTNPGLFSQAGGVVEVCPDGSTRRFNTQAEYDSLVSDHVQAFKTNKDGAEREVSCSLRSVSIVSVRLPQELRALEGLAESPVVFPGYRVLSEKGYDAGSGLYLTRDSGLDARPDRRAGLDAARRLLELFNEFPMQSDEDRGALAAAVLTAANRRGLPTSPAFGLDAPRQGSGKTYLAQCLASIAGTAAPTLLTPATTRGEDDEENRKRLFSALVSGTSTILIDNLVGVVRSPSFAVALTSDTVSDRPLGQTRIVNAPSNQLWLMTGNNLAFAGDMPRRVVMARMDPAMEDPTRRSFSKDPLSIIKANRDAVVRDALTWILASAEEPDPGPIASFEGWSSLIRRAVLWVSRQDPFLRLGDPVEALYSAKGGDADEELLQSILEVLKETMMGEWTTKQLFSLLASTTDMEMQILREDLMAEFGMRSWNARSLGRGLSYRRDRVTGGVVLRERMLKGTLLWRVEKAGE